MKNVPTPVNATEYLLHAQVVRLDALCDMVSSLIEVYAEKNSIATETNVVQEKAPIKRKARSTAKPKA